ncbi:MAG: DUF3604 domain-containing protein [Candidatus Hodarchaeales archaeon]
MKDKNYAMIGRACIEPTIDVVTGSYGTWILTITIGKHGIDDGGHIKVAWRDVTDWEIPQFQKPTEPNFTTVTTTGNVKMDYRFEGFGYIRPWRPCLTITIFDGYLAEGDIITIIYGDTSKGSIGSRIQTFVEDSFEFRILIDSFGTGEYTKIQESPVLRIVAGEPKKLIAIHPSETQIGNSTWISVVIKDKWGNPTPEYTGTIIFSSTDPQATLPKSYTFKHEDKGTHRFQDLIFQTLGIHNVTVSDEDNLNLNNQSNPIVVHEEQLDKILLWGDLHGQTEETVGTGTVNQYFSFARDAAALDYAAHVGNDFQITKDHYKDTQRTVKDFHSQKRFITFLGYEWSGNTPAGGDHNVYFLKDDQPIHRSSHAQIEDKIDLETDRYPISQLYDTFQGRQDVLIIPHIGGRRAIFDYYRPELTPFIEITSVHGHFEWFAREAMKAGLKVGFIGGSDDHTCRPGGANPTSKVEAVNGGLMATFAKELTRDSLWNAFKKRHVYATTGKRIILKVNCGIAMMGDEITISNSPTFNVEIIGTTGIEKVELIRGLEIIYDHPLTHSELLSDTLKIVWSGARVTTRRRNTDWSGKITLDEGKIISAKEFAFDLPWNKILEKGETSIQWSSLTSGDYDGIILTVDAPDTAKIFFDAKPARFSFQLNQLNKPLVIDAGKIDQKVEVSRAPEKDPPSHVKFEFTDEEVKPGMNPYYIRVLQNDGEKAWSSPLYINYISKN